MKNTILYYYNLKNIKMFIKNGLVYFNDGVNIYSFERVRDHNEIMQLYSLNNYMFDQIIININNSIFTPYNGNDYILVRLNRLKKNIFLPLINDEKILDNSPLLRNNWSLIIGTKIDYIEYQYNHIKKKYLIIDESIDYYIGLAENSIQYYEYAMKINENVPLSFCRRRINESKMYNPTNIIIDYRVRDIAEGIKYMYFFKDISITTIIDKVKKIKLSEKEYYLLFSRLLFPSYYFDIYENIVNDRENTSIMEDIIKKREGYEFILTEINRSIKVLKKVEWLS